MMNVILPGYFGKLSAARFSLLIFFAALTSAPAMSAVSCAGRITGVNKWSGMATLSITLTTNDGTATNWINLPSKSEEAIALMAMAGDRPVQIYWSASDITTCANGWAQNRLLDGYFGVTG